MLKELLKSLAERCGYEVLGRRGAYLKRRSLAGLLRQERINLVLDVGANTGQFAGELRAAGYVGRIVSFEPLTSAHAQLLKLAARDAKWTIADRTAVGGEDGSVEIHVAANSVSSSILNMLPGHSQVDPESGYLATEAVPVKRLDDLIALDATDRVMLKIDVQGYERQVLNGAKQVLASCRAVMAEMSLVPLYEGQALAREIWDMLAAANFEAWSLEHGFRNPETGRMLQLDGLFVRSTVGHDRPTGTV